MTQGRSKQQHNDDRNFQVISNVPKQKPYKKIIIENDISFCSNCYSMTHTISTTIKNVMICGKCQKVKNQ